MTRPDDPRWGGSSGRRRRPRRRRLRRPPGRARGAAPRVAAASTRAGRPPARPARPGRAARAAGDDPRARARADPVRAHAGVAVHVLPRRGAHHGVRPRRHAGLGHHGADLRRRAPVELRRVRHARARSSSTSTTSTRRCRAVGVGREAARGELRGRRAAPRGSRTTRTRDGRPRRRCAATASGCAGRRDRACSRRGTTASTPTRSPSGSARSAPRTGSTRSRSSAPRRRSRRRAPATACARSRSSCESSTASCASPPTRRSSCRSRTSPVGRTPRTTSSRCRSVLRGVPVDPATGGIRCEEFTYVHMARKVVGVGSVGTRAWIVLLRGRDDARPAAAAGEAGRGVGARAVPAAEPSTTTTASGSCAGSG